MKKLLALFGILALLILTAYAAYNAGFYTAVRIAEPTINGDMIDIDYGGEIHKYWR